MNNKLRIAFKKKQLYQNNDPSQPVIVTCDVDGNPGYVAGTIPDNNYIDVTDYTEGLDKLTLSWDAIDSDTASAQTSQSEGANNGTTDIGSNYNQGVTLQLRFTGKAFDFIYNWMMLQPCQILNSIIVQITDVDCNRDFRLFEIKVDNIEYAPYDEPCIVETALVESDDVMFSFQTNIIEDDWQKWFNSDGTSAKDHPAFMYVVEKKPTFILVALVALLYIVGILSVGLLIALTGGKEWIRKVLGVCYFCPSPLIRTYIENICSKYGYTFDTIFDDLPGNPYRNACIFYPATKQEHNFDTFDAGNNKFYWDNRIGIAVNAFLDQLKLLFNAEWYCTPDKKLVFKPKSFFNNQAPIYDFTAPGAVKLYNYKTSFNGKKKPNYGRYNYRDDPQDLCSPDPKWRYDTIADFTKGVPNKMLEGSITKDFSFASTAFMYDKTNEDFLESAIKLGRIIGSGAVILGLTELFFILDPITAAAAVALCVAGYVITNDYINDFFDNETLAGAIRTSSNVINVPRVVLWDGESMTRAKVVSEVNPAINATYNLTADDYYTKHPSNDGSGFSTGDKIYNYPMYVDELFTNNLFDRFHELDNPIHNPVLNQEWKAEIDLCCDMAEVLGVWQNQFIRIGAVVILEQRGSRFIKGRIGEIKPNYDTGKIELGGSIIK